MKETVLEMIIRLFSERRLYPDYVNWPEDWKKKKSRRYERYIDSFLAHEEMPHTSETIYETLQRRKSPDTFSLGKDIDLIDIATILRHTIGKNNHGMRLVPSGGAFYPVDVYVVSQDKEYVSVCHFDVEEGSLRRIKKIPLADAKKRPEYKDFFNSQARAALLFTVSFKRSFTKYGLLAVRHAITEVGILAEVISIALLTEGYVSRMYNSFNEKSMNTVLDLNAVSDFSSLSIIFSKE